MLLEPIAPDVEAWLAAVRPASYLEPFPRAADGRWVPLRGGASR